MCYIVCVYVFANRFGERPRDESTNRREEEEEEEEKEEKEEKEEVKKEEKEKEKEKEDDYDDRKEGLFVSSSTNDANGNETSIRNLPYAFIFDIHDSPYFEIAYVYQLSTMINVGLTCVGADTVGPVMILIACGHLKVIQNKMSALMEDAKSNDGEDSYIFQDVKIKLDGYVNYHCTVLEFCKDIEELANVIFLTQLIGSTYNISLVGFKLAGTTRPLSPTLPPSPLPSLPPSPLPPPPPLLLPPSVNYVYGSLQDDPDKYKYTTQTAAVANAAYSMPWYMYSTELKRSMHIIIMRSQRAVRLTAGKFTYLSLETFASVIRNPQYASHNKEIPRSEGVGDDTGTHDPRRRLKGQRGEVKVVVGVGLEIGIGKRGWGQDLRIRETGKKLPMSNEQERKEDSLLFARHLRRTSTNEEAPGDPRELMKSILPADSF
ncbi:odorant receptor 13a-like [Vespula maculifrons]|uniref:Odorant receptor n=1 Tax=Vespula maculifrons TaxID=7453 RepID=A0ABD2CF57_VESMC